MPATAAQQKDVLTDVLSARVPPGFRDQIREAARAEGVRPGTLIRDAINEKIKRAGATPTISPEDRAEIVGVLGEGLVQKIERSTVDPDFRAQLEREVDAARFPFMDRIIAAHGHLSAYIAGQSAQRPGQPIEPADVSEAVDLLRMAFAEMSAASMIEEDLGRLFQSPGGLNG